MSDRGIQTRGAAGRAWHERRQPVVVLQVGCGALGPVDLKARLRRGLAGRFWLADPAPQASARAAAWNLPAGGAGPSASPPK